MNNNAARDRKHAELDGALKGPLAVLKDHEINHTPAAAALTRAVLEHSELCTHDARALARVILEHSELGTPAVAELTRALERVIVRFRQPRDQATRSKTSKTVALDPIVGLGRW